MAKKPRSLDRQIADPSTDRDPLSRLPPQDRKALRRLLNEAGVNDDDWDVLLIGDGSGSKWGYAAGFASVMFDRRNNQTRRWYGGVNDGTVNFAEIMAYLAPLNYLGTQALDAKEQGERFRAVRVEIFTDSQYCREIGNRTGIAPSKNSLLWDCLKAMNRVGVLTRWHWIRRETSPFNSLVDRLSKASRHAIMDV